ncbi:MAG: hypothetical protein ACTH8F_12500 [Microbacterium sp.]|uniref:hypothetical protein n=1 Tax=Microbacterium sp. TaxID=51671 RepID=UPI003F9C09F0
MTEITLTNEQRITIAQQVREHGADLLHAWQEPTEQWDQLAERVEQGGPLDESTIQKLRKAFENTSWDSNAIDGDEAPDHVVDVVNEILAVSPTERETTTPTEISLTDEQRTILVDRVRRGHNAEMWDVALAGELREADETPLIADLAERIREESRGLVSWDIQENDVSAQVFEFQDHRRLQVWDEANFMGDIDGYSWQEQIWSGSEWVDMTEVSTENDIPPLSVDELLLDRLYKFRMDAEATRPESLTPREAALDRMARNAIGASAGMARKVEQLEGKLGTIAEDLRLSEVENGKVRTALLALAQRITAPAERQRSAPENTGPVAGSANDPDSPWVRL